MSCARHWAGFRLAGCRMHVAGLCFVRACVARMGVARAAPNIVSGMSPRVVYKLPYCHTRAWPCSFRPSARASKGISHISYRAV